MTKTASLEVELRKRAWLRQEQWQDPGEGTDSEMDEQWWDETKPWTWKIPQVPYKSKKTKSASGIICKVGNKMYWVGAQ